MLGVMYNESLELSFEQGEVGRMKIKWTSRLKKQLPIRLHERNNIPRKSQMHFCIILSSALLAVLIVKKNPFLSLGKKQVALLWEKSKWHCYSNQPLHHGM
jgi:hypothetical protein